MSTLRYPQLHVDDANLWEHFQPVDAQVDLVKLED
jgi:hypothetical protein